jgi:hypothetical protein
MNVFMFCINDSGGKFFSIYDSFFFRNFHACGYLLWVVSFHYLISTTFNSVFICGKDIWAQEG